MQIKILEAQRKWGALWPGRNPSLSLSAFLIRAHTIFLPTAISSLFAFSGPAEHNENALSPGIWLHSGVQNIFNVLQFTLSQLTNEIYFAGRCLAPLCWGFAGGGTRHCAWRVPLFLVRIRWTDHRVLSAACRWQVWDHLHRHQLQEVHEAQN